MIVEKRIYLFLFVFFLVVAPIYGVTTYVLDGQVEMIGTTVLALTWLMSMMIWGYLAITGRNLEHVRYEDDKDAEVIDGAGALGFFPPSSIWPFWATVVVTVILLGPVFGWWLTLLGLGMGIWAVSGWCYEFYVGDYKH